jgi:hypothetical protein
MIPFSSAVYDLNLSINSSSEFSFKISNDYKFFIKNLNYTSGQETINTTLTYWITDSSGNFIFIRETNSSFKQQTTITRSWTPGTGGNFTVCGNLTKTTANDYDYMNDFACKIITVYSNETEQTEQTGNQTLPQNNSEQNPPQTIQQTNTTQENYNFDYNYSVLNSPFELKEKFSVEVLIINNKEDKNFELWSYVYSGSQFYSVFDREYNKINITLSKKSSEIFLLKNELNLSKIQEGNEYKLKIKILRQNLKTPAEFTYNLSSENFSFQTNTETPENLNELNDESKEINNEKTAEPEEKFESKSYKINKNTVYIFAGLMALLSIYLLINRD